MHVAHSINFCHRLPFVTVIGIHAARQRCSFASECFRLSANELTRQHVAFAYAVARVSPAVIVIQVRNNETRVWNAGEVVRYDIGIGSCMKLN